MQKAKRKPNMPVSFLQRFWAGQSFAFEVPLALEACRQQIEARAKQSFIWYATTQVIDTNQIAFTFYVKNSDSSDPSARIQGTLTRVDGDHTLVAGNAHIPLRVRIMLLVLTAPWVLVGVAAIMNLHLVGMLVMLGLLLFISILFLGVDHEARQFLKHFREIFKEKEPDTETALYHNDQYKAIGEALLQAGTADRPPERQSMHLSQTIAFEVPQSLDECRARINYDFNTRRGTLRAQTCATAADQVAFKINYLGETTSRIRPPIARVKGTLTSFGQLTRVEARVQFPWESGLSLIFSVVLFDAIVWAVVHLIIHGVGNGVMNVITGGGVLMMTVFLIWASYKGYSDTAKGLAGALHTTLNVPPDMGEVEAPENGDEA